tara:strand:+ start:1896 stop:2675 length:780 start_codon:yes stop_codon:yes gene_type:complete
MPPLITLITDLGEQEPFAASIKGTILSHCPSAQIVDLSHQISPHDVTEAALFALGSIPFFPDKTVHLINVAPGPAPIAIRIKNQTVVCPNNGVVTLLSEHYEVEEIHAIDIPDPIADKKEQTFFGREVFAPAAARIAAGAEISDLGNILDDHIRLDWPQPNTQSKSKIDGKIMHVDRFGNLITNIHRKLLDNSPVERISTGNFSIFGLSESYSDVMSQHPLALFGHSGYLEIAYNGDRANDRLGLSPGLVISVLIGSDN